MTFSRALRAAAAILLLGSVAPAAAKEWTKIRIGTEGAYRPFNYIDSDKQLKGFEIDLARAICERMEVKCEFVAQDWEGLIPALLAGKYDVIFASLSITDERRKAIEFSTKYYASPSLFVAPKESGDLGTTPEAMKGKTIGAQAATVSARYLETLYAPAGVEVKLYVTLDEANFDLASGRVDAVFADKIVQMSWLEKTPEGKCCQVIGPDYSDPAFFGSGIGAGLRKSDPDLKDLIDKGIAAIRADGTYGRINARYFPYDVF